MLNELRGCLNINSVKIFNFNTDSQFWFHVSIVYTIWVLSIKLIAIQSISLANSNLQAFELVIINWNLKFKIVNVYDVNSVNAAENYLAEIDGVLYMHDSTIRNRLW